jgi:hypothetical protein
MQVNLPADQADINMCYNFPRFQLADGCNTPMGCQCSTLSVFQAEDEPFAGK